MVEITVNTKALDSFRMAWDANAQKARVAAFKGEAFRLFTELQQGLGDEANTLRLAEAAALTRAIRKEHRGSRKSLKYIAGQVAYRVDDLGNTVVATIGPATRANVLTDRGFRRLRKPLSVAALTPLAEGHRQMVTREVQNWVAYKIRKRMGEPVQNPNAVSPYQKSWHKKRQRMAAGKAAWKPIPKGMIPRLHRSLDWPGRPWVQRLVYREALTSVKNIEDLFRVALAGRRWPKRWWGPGGRYLGG